jgi:hypothetical protein
MLSDCWREPNERPTHKVSIYFTFEGIRGREVYYVHDTRKLRWNRDPVPEGLAWREFEHEMIFDLDVPTQDCICCISMSVDLHVDFVIENLVTSPLEVAQ